MRRVDIHADLSSLAFDFFYYFSRFEFALKENHYLKSHKAGQVAEAGWKEFVAKCSTQYKTSREASELIELSPHRQVVLADGTLAWKPLDMAVCKSELDAVVLCLKTVRNNLFHGGKHTCVGWDNPARIRALLASGKAVLGQLADLAEIESDYSRFY